MKKCELWLGTKTGRFMYWSVFDSIAECKRYIKGCITCYHEKNEELFEIDQDKFIEIYKEVHLLVYPNIHIWDD